MKILILCTGNSCRSQMAEGFLKSYDSNLEVYSAGTNPSSQVHPKAIQVMQEVNIDLSKNRPKSVEEFLGVAFDFVITVCAGANESCPVFTGKVQNRLHIGFEDPAEVVGTEAFILSEFRRIRDEIIRDFTNFYNQSIRPLSDAKK
ncbi:MAG: arsenate reductase ArsC [Bacteroidales bacterium]|nr:arsenate reductase ArsC [Bacteroidales bacterium]